MPTYVQLTAEERETLQGLREGRLVAIPKAELEKIRELLLKAQAALDEAP